MFGLTTTDRARELPDEEILARSQSEPWIFVVLIDRYQDAFMRKAMSILHYRLDAEEVVQDTFTKIYQKAHTFTPQAGATFSSWGYRILMNTAFTLYQKKVKEKQRFTQIDPEFEQFVADKTSEQSEKEGNDLLERILLRLPVHLAEVLRLHYLERWSHEEIAGKLGANTGMIKARIHRAKAAFRREAGEDEIDLLLQDRN